MRTVVFSTRLDLGLAQWVVDEAAARKVKRTDVIQAAVQAHRDAAAAERARQNMRTVESVARTYGAMVEGGAW